MVIFLNFERLHHMKTLSSFGTTCALVMVVIMVGLVPGKAVAQATRTWVSGAGDDANACSRAAPCKTFAGAISKTAADGEINCIDAGSYGAVTITKSIVIDCVGSNGGVLNSGSYGFVVNSGAGSRVTLRNVSADGAGTGLAGVRILTAGAVHLEEMLIRGQNGNGVEVLSTTNVQVSMVRLTVRDNSGHGVVVTPATGITANVTASKSISTSNGKTGIRVDDGGTAVVSDSILSANTTHGATAASASGSAKVMLDRVVSTGNALGGVLAYGPQSVVLLSNCLLVGNQYGLYPAIGGGIYVSAGNNSAYANTNGDGVYAQTIPQF